ncbi:MAG TPA: hypothetical protein VFG23_02065 [Polyangia bacterium]|nr:hypothetical protein [Polyangia bacterium]
MTPSNYSTKQTVGTIFADASRYPRGVDLDPETRATLLIGSGLPSLSALAREEYIPEALPSGGHDPAAVTGPERASALFAVYGSDDAQHSADQRDAEAASRLRRSRMAVDEIAAFGAPLLVTNDGKAI